MAALPPPHARRESFVDPADGALHIPERFACASLGRASSLPPHVAPSGATVVFHCSDDAYERLGGGARAGEGPVPATAMAEANVVTGPLFVQGAAPGDAVLVEVLDVRIRRCWSVWTSDEEVSGILAPKLAATGRSASVRQLPIDDAGQAVEISARLRIPLEPMIGCIATAPAPHEECGYACGCSTFEPTFRHGGNMDLRELSKGASILLPVQQPGALLSVGDLHACMVRHPCLTKTAHTANVLCCGACVP